MEELEATQEQMQRQVNELSELRNVMEQEKQLFTALMDYIPDAVYFKDRQSKLIRVSKYLADRFKMTVKEMIGKSDFDFQDEIHARAAYEDEMEIIRTGIAKIDFVEKETHKDGSDHYVSTTKMPLYDTQGNTIGTFGLSRDITKLKRLEIDILNKEKKFKAEEQEYENRIRMLERKINAKEEEIQELKRRMESK
jgi:PAS domain S-box-containing protein